MTIKIRARDVAKVFETTHGPVTALHGFDLEVREGEFVCIVGPSGCGKSTFLRILAELEPATSGYVSITPGSDPSKPSNNVVFQEYAVFPWKTVRQNVEFGLRMRGVPRKTREREVERWLGRVGLTRFADAFPSQLSGGMKQRVSIARALANDPEVLLMDEPLGALDAQTRLMLQEELLRLWEETGKTIVYITHSLEEAVLLSGRVVVMTAHPGTVKRVVDIDLPRPRSIETTATARFAELSGRLWEELRDEVARTLEADA